uniref:Glycosyl hydrolase family 38 C-terminal domain-containing protein n=1 Tax=Lactuca sativa TaxID=4236 RepID=A0A9R1VPJ8_LACSA|nr:hypothetical protein LSAT_V11C500257990 [Lactuca sativa]
MSGFLLDSSVHIDFLMFGTLLNVEGAMEHSYNYYSSNNGTDQIGPIRIDDGVGKEITTQITSALKTNKTFYTNSNSKDFIKRVRDFRTDWELQVNEPVARNYYPG